MWTYVAIAIGGTLGCWARFAQTNLVQTVCGAIFHSRP
jgi:fluoride exporter